MECTVKKCDGFRMRKVLDGRLNDGKSGSIVSAGFVMRQSIQVGEKTYKGARLDSLSIW